MGRETCLKEWKQPPASAQCCMQCSRSRHTSVSQTSITQSDTALRAPKAQRETTKAWRLFFLKLYQKATRASFNVLYLPVMSAASISQSFQLPLLCLFQSLPSARNQRLKTPRLRPFFYYYLLIFFANTPPPQCYGNVLWNYSGVNRAGSRNEITATGAVRSGEGAIRQQEMTRRPNLHSITRAHSLIPPLLVARLRNYAHQGPSAAWSLSINLIQRWSMARRWSDELRTHTSEHFSELYMHKAGKVFTRKCTI